MERFKNILLVVNSEIKNPAAMHCAVSLAINNQASLKVVDVVKETSRYQPILPSSVKNINLHDVLVQEKRELIEEFIRPFQSSKIQISSKILTGIPFIEIIREVIRKQYDLVVVSPEGGREFTDMLFGTTVMHLMRKCPCAVWAIKPSSHTRFSRILAAVDPDPLRKDEVVLNRTILEMAASLAELHKSELHVLHSWLFPVSSTLIGENNRDEMRNELQGLYEESFSSLVHEYGPKLPASNIHLIEGEAGREIPRFAKEHNVDLIVMGTVSRTGIPGLFIGNTAEKILYRVECSVLAVKPTGFISPITLE